MSGKATLLILNTASKRGGLRKGLSLFLSFSTAENLAFGGKYEDIPRALNSRTHFKLSP